MTPIATVILALVCVGIGLGIAEFYHYKIDRVRAATLPLDQPDMWDLTPPAPQPVMTAQDYTRMKRTGQVTKLVGGGRR